MSYAVPLIRSMKMFDGRTIEVVYNDNVKVTVEKVDELFEMYDQMVGTGKVVKLLIIGKGTTITSDARDYIVRQNVLRKENTIAEAIVVHTTAQMIASNIYIKFLDNTYPIRHFTNRDKAREWLQEQYDRSGAGLTAAAGSRL